MILSISARRKALWILFPLAVLLVIVGCAGIQPYKWPDWREEGPEKGLFSGSAGEFVIYEKADETTKGTQDKKSANEAGSAVKKHKADGNHGADVEKPAGNKP